MHTGAESRWGPSFLGIGRCFEDADDVLIRCFADPPPPFLGGCVALRSRQLGARAQIPPHPHQHFLFSVFFFYSSRPDRCELANMFIF